MNKNLFTHNITDSHVRYTLLSISPVFFSAVTTVKLEESTKYKYGKKEKY